MSATLFSAVDSILVAEFDIDRGSSLTHQYPIDTGVDPHVLAELMLPDGAHLRDEDWTMFLLNQKEAGQMERPLLYVLNLVRTKHISTVRRGARVKAMAIASRYQWVHVFKPLLILALEKFFEDPGVSILEDLFYSLNSLDISRIPRLSMSEKKIFRGTEDHKILDDKLLEDEQKAAAASALRDTKDGRASDLTAINVEAASIQSEATHKPTNKDRQFFETAVQYSGIRVPLRIPLVMYREEFGDVSKEPNSKEHWKAGIQYSWHPDIDYGAQTHPIMLIMNAILAGKRVLFLGDKKPSGEVANYVLAACALVGGGGVITGLTQRCYPYVSLAGLDTLLATQDYIAGVTNPVFEEQQTWWDVLCNVNTGKITVSPHLIASVGSRDNDYAGGSTKEREKEWNRSMRWEGENELALEVSRRLKMRSSSFALTLAQSHASEFTLRQKFFDYVLRFTEVASVYDRDHNGDRQSAISIQPQHVTYPEMGFGTYFASPAAKKKELGMLINRIGAWMRTRSFANYRRVSGFSFLI
ncbi:docking domain of Afi1 for Arf3 in vesicle trafficking-domain-containing protein [Fimicolochytrium jonesii]|uniref:docking domain of Afi1 for Arf3 in vesicle trafficking-domain-containing protein n=1 Tax=Fimicolochytrium jonesii TaxID=1396493 RepID=UPI0022FEC578|nr:docking domain of Afi1 for Arf3 in vesicle trafficking-domain-containing protein [Fimicolochytrium jonesii]KAI8816280.1 docking domain of Afi1 for Arf3 in vesicle trafficking-domain-containing protein [Fimicolochytrium jonesii]